MKPRIEGLREEELDYRTETPVRTETVRPRISWRWGSIADMPALRISHFESEVAAGRALYLPNHPSDTRTIIVAESGDQMLGGVLAEDTVAMTLIETNPEVLESATQAVVPIILDVAGRDGTRFLQISLPQALAERMTETLHRAGFKRQENVQFVLDTGVEERDHREKRTQ